MHRINYHCHMESILRLMIAAIKRTDPWSVFTRQLNNQHLCGDLCTALSMGALQLF